MRSWVFRHRQRLRVIYGIAPATAPMATPPANARARTAPGALDPGEWRRTGRHLVIRPMRRRGA